MNYAAPERNRALDSHNMDEFKVHFAMQKRPDSKGYKLYESTVYMIFWRKQKYRNGIGKWL